MNTYSAVMVPDEGRRILTSTRVRAIHISSRNLLGPFHSHAPRIHPHAKLAMTLALLKLMSPEGDPHQPGASPSAQVALVFWCWDPSLIDGIIRAPIVDIR